MLKSHPTPRWRVPEAVQDLGDLLLASDPDLSRLFQGGRAALSAAGAFAVLALLTGWLRLPIAVAMVGGSLGMMAATQVSDAGQHAQRRTSVLLALPGCLCFASSALLAPYRWPSLGAFLAIIFTGVWARRFGPRGQALGTLAFNAYFFALFYRPVGGELPWMMGAIAVAVVIAHGVRFLLLRDLPERSALWAFRGIRAQGSWLLRQTARAVTDGWTGVARTRMRGALARWDEAVLSLDDQLSSQGGSEEERAHLFQLESAMARLVAELRHTTVREVLDARGRAELRAQLLAARPALRRGRPLDTAAVALPTLRKLLEVTAQAPIIRLNRGAPPASAARLPMANAALPDAAPPGLSPATRQAIQATLAAAVAMALGQLISPVRWIWAVVATYVVFTKSSTRGDTLLRAWERVLGTVAGVGGGLVVAELIRGHPAVELGALFVCIFLAFYFLRLSYTAMVLSLTLAVCLLYILVGRFSPGLLYLRLEETLIGATVGGLVAAFVLPTRTGSHVVGSLVALLRATASVLDTLGKPETPLPLDSSAVRPLATRLRAFREAVKPLRQGLGARRRDAAGQLQAASSLVFWTRQLARDPCPPDDGQARARLELIRRLSKVTTRLANDFQGGQDAARSQVPEEVVQSLPPATLHSLGRVEETLAELARPPVRLHP